MEIPLNLPPGERQQEFIDQFNAALRRISSGGTGTAGFLEDHSFEASLTGAFRLGAGVEAPLTWTLHKTPKGTLTDIRVDVAGPDAPQGWTSPAHQLVTSALAATVAGTRARFFQRISFAYVGPALDGEYWLPGFRIGPAIPDDAVPESPLVERWVDIDMNVDAVDRTHAGAVAGERARRIAARLSLLLDLGFERPPLEFRWVMIPETNDKFECRRCQVMFQRTDEQPSAMPDKGELCQLGRFTTEFAKFRIGRVQLPRGVRRVLRGADTRPYPVGDAFDRCARLYQVGRLVAKAFPSVFLAYAIAAAEAITQADRTYKGFTDFMKKHSVAAKSQSYPVLKTLYGRVRSAHFHAGDFPLGEFGPFRADSLMDEKWVEASNLRSAGLMAVRAAIIDWCLKSVAVKPKG